MLVAGAEGFTAGAESGSPGSPRSTRPSGSSAKAALSSPDHRPSRGRERQRSPKEPKPLPHPKLLMKRVLPQPHPRGGDVRRPTC